MIRSADNACAPSVVCLCGSTRFKGAFDDANYRETMAGKIVLSVGFYMHASGNRHGEHVGATPEQKERLDELHLRKIDLADEVIVLNVGGYIGESTRREVAYALASGVPVRWLEPLPRACDGHPAQECDQRCAVRASYAEIGKPPTPAPLTPPSGYHRAKQATAPVDLIAELDRCVSGLNDATWVVSRVTNPQHFAGTGLCVTIFAGARQFWEKVREGETLVEAAKRASERASRAGKGESE